MATSKHVEKLEKYFDRLHAGKVSKIKPSHVQKIIDKLAVKAAQIEVEREEALKTSKRERLGQKLLVIEEQISRAKWLLARLERPEDQGED